MSTGRKILLIIIVMTIAATAAFSLYVFLKSKSDKSLNIDTAQKLADSLKKEGIDYQTIEKLNLDIPKVKIDEAIALKGDNIWIEILRIEDKKTYELFGATGIFTGALKNSINNRGGEVKNMPPSILAKKPFIITVRQEAKKGQIMEALKKIFPEYKK